MENKSKSFFASNKAKRLYIIILAVLLATALILIVKHFTKTEQYVLTVVQTENGDIYPAGETMLELGAEQTLVISPEAGYRVKDVIVDGESKGAVTVFTLNDISADHTVTAIFEKIGFEKMVELTYTFSGDEKNKAGFAQGTLTVTPTADGKKDGYYLVYFADESGLLEDYDEFACIGITGGSVSFDIKDGAYLPAEVTKLAVFECERRFLEEHPNIEDAADVINIDYAKRLELGEVRYTFGATSDVHMNFESLGFGSLDKWENALEFFAGHNVESLIVTGDMTGDTELDSEYQQYIDRINDSDIPLESVYEAIGNHGNTSESVKLFAKYTGGSDEVHPFEGSPYYYVLKKNENGRDNLFIFMAQELKSPGDSAAYDNFSKRQIDWLESTLEKFENTDTNIFLIEHSPFLNWSPGDRIGGDYTRMVTFKESYVQTMRLKSLLEKHKNVIMMTGHTHFTFYENENYSDQYGSFCRMVHVSSGTQTSSYNHGDTLISDTDGRKNNSPDYGSEGYIVKVYDDYIVFIGYNISTNRIIPYACILIPTIPYESTAGEVSDPTVKDITDAKYFLDVVKGSGTKEDPYLISSEEEFKLMTDEFVRSTASDEQSMFGYGKYFEQTRDLDMCGFEGYNGTSASGSTRYTFAGNYNGNGYTVKVDISDGGQMSVFPYSYGVISNLKVEGSIKGGVCAQVVRALYGELINCVFDVALNAEQEGGAIYSNYGYVYNLYTTGTHSSSAVASAVATNHNSTQYTNVFYCRYQNSSLVASPHGTQSEDLNAIAESFNVREGSEYEKACEYLDGYDMLEVVAADGKLAFQKAS